MFINELQYERNLLEYTLNHHLNKLYAPDNPKGILLCQKHKNTYRWQHKYLLNGSSVTVDLRKADAPLAEKLAVNLYRIVCIQFLQVQITSIDSMIRSSLSGKPLEICKRMDADKLLEIGKRMGAGKQMEVTGNGILAENPMRELLRKVHNCPRVPADFFRSESPYRPFILSHLWHEYTEVIDWYLGDFRQYTEHPEHRQYRIRLGYNVRSKSEMIAANRMHEEGILFHYEEILMAGDDEFPDFFIMITVVEKYAWEHFGAMDNDRYHSRQRVKILDYLDHQWFPGINMITTYETEQHPLTEEQIDHQIRWLKNRYRMAFPDLPPDESFNMYDLAGYVKRYRAEQ